jgi:hypothetical protein
MTKATETTGERRDVTCGPALSHRRLFASLRAHDRPRALGAPSPTHVVVPVRRRCHPTSGVDEAVHQRITTALEKSGALLVLQCTLFSTFPSG